MIEMKYFPDFMPGGIILDQGSYKGFNYFAVNYGPHPCAYVEIPRGHDLYGDEGSVHCISCHGGITYVGSGDNFYPYDGMEHWFIGWDYAHAFDYSGYHMLGSEYRSPYFNEKKWTTAEIVQECRDVIDQLVSEVKNNDSIPGQEQSNK
ncbi:hypothetical protein [Ruminococcus sp.]|uniref:hypothetical protein n=1 Tax=Ruminococcus sp. TaxID=41978 RepID=UPI001B696CE3|nr:hypothetical protein [Ruminococcus sp.]MBP5433618.1 hypothetical protein [Ruminococcus sp.]